VQVLLVAVVAVVIIPLILMLILHQKMLKDAGGQLTEEEAEKFFQLAKLVWRVIWVSVIQHALLGTKLDWVHASRIALVVTVTTECIAINLRNILDLMNHLTLVRLNAETEIHQ
jgi:hypothetical protein